MPSPHGAGGEPRLVSWPSRKALLLNPSRLKTLLCLIIVVSFAMGEKKEEDIEIHFYYLGESGREFISFSPQNM